MNGLELRSSLAASLSDELGTFTLADGTTTTPAISLGPPPTGASVSGIEVTIGNGPAYRVTPAYQTGAIHESYTVRVTNHGGSWRDVRTVVRKVLSRFPRASVSQVPANERLGILHEYVITIPVENDGS